MDVFEQIKMGFLVDEKKNEEEELLIAPLIPFGKRNAVSRKQLSIRAGVSDRKMRSMIEHDRAMVPIISTQSGEGYYRPTPEERSELLRFIKENKSRALSVMKWVVVAGRAYRDL